MSNEAWEDDFSVDEEEIMNAMPEDLPEALQELAAANSTKAPTNANKENSATRRIIKPRPKVDTSDLLANETGLSMIRTLLMDKLPCRLSPRHASEPDRALVMQDATQVIRLFKDWAHTHLPALTMETFCERAEKLGAKDHTLKMYLRVLREKIEEGKEGVFQGKSL